MGEISNRRNELVAERELLEAARSAIITGVFASSNDGLKKKVTDFIETQQGQDGQRMHGEQVITVIIDPRLKMIREEINSLPYRAILPTAQKMNVLGKDLSQYQPSDSPPLVT